VFAYAGELGLVLGQTNARTVQLTTGADPLPRFVAKRRPVRAD